MDKHWQQLINAKGGAPGYSVPQDPARSIKRIRPTAGRRPALYEDINGVQFTVSDVRERQSRPLSKSNIAKRIERYNTFEEVVGVERHF